MTDAIRQINVSEVTYYRWRQEFGGLQIEQVKRLKELRARGWRVATWGGLAVVKPSDTRDLKETKVLQALPAMHQRAI